MTAPTLFAICLLVLSISEVSPLPTDCQDLLEIGFTQSGVYTIYPRTAQGFRVYCDMTNGGWTVIQKRIDGSENFKRDWNSYLTGFGRADHEYWFGNQQIHLLKTSGWYQLRFDMTNQTGHSKQVLYDVFFFYIGDAESGFRLFIDGFHGDNEITDDFRGHHLGMKFSTYDRDQDGSVGYNCGDFRHGGWWYNQCQYADMNGHYGNTAYGEGINWGSWTGFYSSLTRVEMKVRRYALL